MCRCAFEDAPLSRRGTDETDADRKATMTGYLHDYCQLLSHGHGVTRLSAQIVVAASLSDPPAGITRDGIEWR